MVQEANSAPLPIPTLEQKLDRCADTLRALKRVVVAFSAGVDSTFLLALATETLGADLVLAAVGVSPSLPERELAEARHYAETLGVELVEVVTGEMDDPRYASNPAERCYFCKHDLFERLTDLAAKRDAGVVVSGANADDTGDFRPGLRAGRELGVRNPLMESGLTKADIRELSRRMSVPTWDKPAMACLASRVPYGQPITPEVLKRVERTEAALHDLGFRACRVRCHGQVARIELPVDDFSRAIECREAIVAAASDAGFSYIGLDLKGLRSGSMNEVLTAAVISASA